ncbi:MAG: cyclic nucleotide-binding domain-containing protein [Acidimicrobiales bacterium]|nr:cyclic nucleotide-binding domain-containing protein [Acidimicrobiales bacterium]
MLTDRFANASETAREFADGELIVRKGDPGREMFIIQSGGAIVRNAAGEEIARLRRGEFFGEMSVLESSPRDADVFADGDTRVLALGSGALFIRLRRDPSFALELLQALSGRVRALNERLQA